MAACLLFLCSGLVFVPHLGLQNDEALFASPLFDPIAADFSIKMSHSRIPLMLMSYLGTLKSWIYLPVFQSFNTGIAAIRIPMVLAGAASVWLFYLLLRRITGERAALIGCGLLAVDSLYMLTIVFDWGPVALQHLLLMSGALLLMRFYQHGSHRSLGWGGFLLGLLMWDKALAIWMLSGMGVALLCTATKSIVRVTTLRRLGIVTLGFCLGALPLIIYNAKNHLATFRNNTSWETRDIPGKARLLAATADGHGLFGWLVLEDWQTDHPHQPRSALTAASANISTLAGHPRHNLTLYAFVLALLLAPLARGDALRAIVFSLIAMGVAWGQMAITANAGGSVHHAILIWPLPQMAIAISFAAASRRLGRAGVPVLAAVLLLMMSAGLLVSNEYYTRMRRNGGGMNWTDAIFRLSDRMKTTRADNVFCVDWGIMDSLRLLNRGTVPLRVGTDPITKPELSEIDRAYLEKMISGPSNVFINHTKDFEFMQDVNAKLVKYAAGQGYRREIDAVIADSYQRPVYEVYRFSRDVSQSGR